MPLTYSPAGARHPWTVSACLHTETQWVRGANAGVEGKERETTSTSGTASRKSLPCRDVKNKPVTAKGFGKHFNLPSLYRPFISALLTLPCISPCCFPSSPGRHHCCRGGLLTAASSSREAGRFYRRAVHGVRGWP